MKNQFKNFVTWEFIVIFKIKMMVGVSAEQKAQEMVSIILKALQREDDPMTSLLEIYIKAELESYHNNQPK